MEKKNDMISKEQLKEIRIDVLKVWTHIDRIAAVLSDDGSTEVKEAVEQLKKAGSAAFSAASKIRIAENAREK